jgi:transposase
VPLVVRRQARRQLPKNEQKLKETARAVSQLQETRAVVPAQPTPAQPVDPVPAGPPGRSLATARLVAKGDPDRDQVLADLHQQIRNLPDGAVVLAEDETHVNLLPWVRATWVVRGTRQQVMTPGKNRRRTIFGAVDIASGRFPYQVAHKAVSASFCAFLAQLLAAYPVAPIVAVVCDNVIIHHSKILQRWLAAHPRVVVLHGARYSPHDNPVERIWAALQAWLANSPTLTIQGRVRQVHAFFRARSPAQLLVTAAPSSSLWLPEGYTPNFRQAA